MSTTTRKPPIYNNNNRTKTLQLWKQLENPIAVLIDHSLGKETEIEPVQLESATDAVLKLLHQLKQPVQLFEGTKAIKLPVYHPVPLEQSSERARVLRNNRAIKCRTKTNIKRTIMTFFKNDASQLPAVFQAPATPVRIPATPPAFVAPTPPLQPAATVVPPTPSVPTTPARSAAGQAVVAMGLKTPGGSVSHSLASSIKDGNESELLRQQNEAKKIDLLSTIIFAKDPADATPAPPPPPPPSSTPAPLPTPLGTPLGTIGAAPFPPLGTNATVAVAVTTPAPAASTPAPAAWEEDFHNHFNGQPELTLYVIEEVFTHYGKNPDQVPAGVDVKAIHGNYNNAPTNWDGHNPSAAKVLLDLAKHLQFDPNMYHPLIELYKKAKKN